MSKNIAYTSHLPVDASKPLTAFPRARDGSLKAPANFHFTSGEINAIPNVAGRRFRVAGQNPYPASQRVRVTLRDGQVLEDRVGAFDWSIGGTDADIVKYEDI